MNDHSPSEQFHFAKDTAKAKMVKDKLDKDEKLEQQRRNKVLLDRTNRKFENFINGIFQAGQLESLRRYVVENPDGKYVFDAADFAVMLESEWKQSPYEVDSDFWRAQTKRYCKNADDLLRKIEQETMSSDS